MAKSSSSYLKVSERKVLLRLFDIASIFLFLMAANLYLPFDYFPLSNEKSVLWLITIIFYFYLFGQIFQLYSLNVSNNRFRVVQSVFLTTMTTTVFFVFTPFLSPELPDDRMQIIYLFAGVLFSVLVWRFVYLLILRSPKYFKNIILISHSSKVKEIFDLIQDDGIHNTYSIVSEKQVIDDTLFSTVENVNLHELISTGYVNEIVIDLKGFSSEIISKLNNEIILLFEEGVNIKSYETFYEEITQSVPKEYLNYKFYNNINLSKNNDSRFYNFFHRTLDIIISTVGFCLFIILFPLILICNLIGNRGPIFYTQNRVGEKGRVFKILKLRTMIPNAEKNGVQFTVKNDKRITFFGKFLRNTRVDEMPQFLNILMGDMSLIGPRPERPEVVELLEEKIPFYAIRHVIKPGLTGWAQVSYPYAGTIEEQEEKLRYDLYYIKQQSPFLDFKIIIKTITTILLFRGQ